MRKFGNLLQTLICLSRKIHSSQGCSTMNEKVKFPLCNCLTGIFLVRSLCCDIVVSWFYHDDFYTGLYLARVKLISHWDINSSKLKKIFTKLVIKNLKDFRKIFALSNASVLSRKTQIMPTEKITVFLLHEQVFFPKKFAN